MASSQHAALVDASVRVALDPRADHGTRTITLATNMIHIERVLNGVKMRVHIPAKIYRGVSLLVRERPDGKIYEIELAHRDPDLSVCLEASNDKAKAEDLQQQWACFFARPVVPDDPSSLPTKENSMFVSAPRRRCMTHVAKRRPRRLFRRKLGNRENLTTVRRNEREIICYE